jgi:hypothetical protein
MHDLASLLGSGTRIRFSSRLNIACVDEKYTCIEDTLTGIEIDFDVGIDGVLLLNMYDQKLPTVQDQGMHTYFLLLLALAWNGFEAASYPPVSCNPLPDTSTRVIKKGTGTRSLCSSLSIDTYHV